MNKKVQVGHRVYVGPNRASSKLGTVRYVGAFHLKPGTFVGVEYDQPVGKNNGTIGGNQYFSCAPNHGAMTMLGNVHILPLAEQPLHLQEGPTPAERQEPIETTQRSRQGRFEGSRQAHSQSSQRLRVEKEITHRSRSGSPDYRGMLSTRSMAQPRTSIEEVRQARSIDALRDVIQKGASSLAQLTDTMQGRNSYPLERRTSSQSTQSVPATLDPEALARKTRSEHPTVGDMVVTDRDLRGILRYVGQTKFHPGVVWAGIELATAQGRNDGSIDHVRYFTCQPKHGLFVPYNTLRVVKDVAYDLHRSDELSMKMARRVQSIQEEVKVKMDMSMESDHMPGSSPVRMPTQSAVGRVSNGSEPVAYNEAFGNLDETIHKLQELQKLCAEYEEQESSYKNDIELLQRRCQEYETEKQIWRSRAQGTDPASSSWAVRKQLIFGLDQLRDMSVQIASAGVEEASPEVQGAIPDDYASLETTDELAERVMKYSRVLSRQLDGVKIAVDGKEQDVDQIRREYTKLERQKIVLDKTLESWAKKVATGTELPETTQAYIDVIETTLSKSEDTKNQLDRMLLDLDLAKTERTRAIEELQSFKTEMDNLRQEQRGLQSVYHEFKGRIETVVQTVQSEQEGVQNSLRSSEEHLQTKLIECESALSEAQAKNARLLTMLAQNYNQIQQSLKALTDLKSSKGVVQESLKLLSALMQNQEVELRNGMAQSHSYPTSSSHGMIEMNHDLLDEIAEDLERLSSRAAAVGVGTTNSQTRIEELQTEVTRLQQDHAAKEAQISELSSLHTQSTTLVQGHVEQLSALQSRVSQLEDENAALHERLAKDDSEIQSLNEQVRAQQQEIEARLSSSGHDLEQLQRALSDSQQQYGTSEKELGHLRQQLATAESELSNTRNELLLAKESNQSLIQSSAAYEEQVSKVSLDVDQAKVDHERTRTALTVRINELESEIEATQSVLKQQEQVWAAKLDRVETAAQEDKTQMEEDIQSTKNACEELKELLLRTRGKLNETEAREKEVVRELEHVVEMLKSEKTSSHEKEVQLNELQSRLVEMSSSSDAAEQLQLQLASLQTDKANAEQALTSALEERHQFSVQVQELASRVENLAGDYEREKADLVETRQYLAVAEKARDTAQDEVKDAYSKLDELETKVWNLEDALNDRQETREQSAETTEKLRQDILDVQERLTEVTQEKEALGHELTRFRESDGHLSKLEGELREARATNQTMGQQLQEALAETNTTKMTLIQLQEEHVSLKEMHTKALEVQGDVDSNWRKQAEEAQVQSQFREKELSEEIDRLQSKVQELEDIKTHSEAREKDISEKINHLSGMMEQMEKTKAGNESREKELSQEISRLRTELATKEESLRTLGDSATIASDSRAELERARSEAQLANQAMRDLEELVQESDTKAANLEAALRQAELQANQARAALAAQVAETQSGVAEASTAAEVKKLGGELAAKEELCQKLSKKLDAKTAHADELQAQLVDVQTRGHDLTVEIQEAQDKSSKDLAELMATKRDNEEALENLSRELESAHGDLQSKDLELQGIRTRVDLMQQENQLLKDALKNSASETSAPPTTVEKDTTETLKRLQIVEAEASELRSQVRRKEESLETAVAMNEELGQKLDQLRNDLVTLEASKDSDQSAAAVHESAALQLNEDHTNDITEMQEAMSSLETYCMDLETALENQKEEVQNLHTAQKQRLADSLKDAVAQLQATHSSRASNFDAERSRLVAVITDIAQAFGLDASNVEACGRSLCCMADDLYTALERSPQDTVGEQIVEHIRDLRNECQQLRNSVEPAPTLQDLQAVNAALKAEVLFLSDRLHLADFTHTIDATGLAMS
eukprot:Clim_evm3s51 gene=Clim_evmTU3s51